MLPTEVRLQIYEELLACPSTIVEYVPRKIRTTKSRFQIKTASPLSPQLLRVCRQIRREGLPILYGNHQFNCDFSARSIGKLRAQIGLKNFGYIKHLIVRWLDMRWMSYPFPINDIASFYQSLETLEISGYFGIDLAERTNGLYFGLSILAYHCKTTREILRYHPHLSVLAHTRVKDPDATDQSCTEFHIRWRLLRSPLAIRPKVGSSERLPLRGYCQLSSDSLTSCPGTHP